MAWIELLQKCEVIYCTGENPPSRRETSDDAIWGNLLKGGRKNGESLEEKRIKEQICKNGTVK